jgi:carbamoyl-phosphate synthase small subunit
VGWAGCAGIADVDTRAITRRLRDTGALNGIITTDLATPVEELVQQTKSWSILGKDLISEVTCREPYEWKDPTEDEWEFNPAAKNGKIEKPFHVRSRDLDMLSERQCLHSDHADPNLRREASHAV